MKKALSYLAVLSIFLDNFVLTRTPIDLYYYYFIFILIIGVYAVSTWALPINKQFVYALSVICLVSFIKSYWIDYPITPAIKQLVNITISSVPFYLILKINSFDLRKVFRIYINVALAICWIGILQVLVYFIFKVDFGYEYKLTSIVSEPSHVAITLAPAFFLALNKLFLHAKTNLINYKESVLITLTWVLTMSAVAMLGIILAAVILAINKYNILNYRIRKKNLIYILILAISLGSFTTIIYQNVPFIKFRVDDTWQALSTTKGGKVQNINLSTYALYSNYLVTKEALRHNPLLGSGLGTHSINYDLYLDKVYNLQDPSYRSIEYNREDANSLFLRLLSELGIVGLSLFIILLYTLNIKTVKANLQDLWLLNNACLLFFLMRLVRFGNYSVLGFFLFLFIYYYTFKEHQYTLKTNELD